MYAAYSVVTLLNCHSSTNFTSFHTLW